MASDVSKLPSPVVLAELISKEVDSPLVPAGLVLSPPVVLSAQEVGPPLQSPSWPHVAIGLPSLNRRVYFCQNRRQSPKKERAMARRSFSEPSLLFSPSFLTLTPNSLYLLRLLTLISIILTQIQHDALEILVVGHVAKASHVWVGGIPSPIAN